MAQSPARRSTFSYALDSAGSDRQADLGEHLPVADGGLVGAAVELGHVDHPLPTASADHAARVERGAHRRQVLRGVGLAERAAQRAPVADDRVGDDPLGVAEDRERVGEGVGLQELAVAGHRADPDVVGLDADVAELAVQVVDVDQVLRRGQPELHHRQQAVAPCHQPGLRTQPLQQVERVVDARGALVLERCRHLHVGPPATTTCMPLSHGRERTVNADLRLSLGRASRRRSRARRVRCECRFAWLRPAAAGGPRARQVPAETGRQEGREVPQGEAGGETTEEGRAEAGPRPPAERGLRGPGSPCRSFPALRGRGGRRPHRPVRTAG